jgi:hypothetical protein
MADAEYKINIGVESNSAVAAAESMGKLSGMTEAVAKSAATAAAAVKTAQTAYDASEKAANKAALALERINIKLGEQSIKMRDALVSGDVGAVQRAAVAMQKLTAAQAAAAAKASASAEALKGEAAALDALKKSSETAKASEDLASSAAGSGKVNEMAEAFGKLGGPLGAAGQKAFGTAEGIKKLYASMGSNAAPVLAAVGIAAVAAAIIAVAAAVVVGIARIGLWAFGLSNAANASALLSDGIAGSVAGGRELDKTIDGLASKVPQSRAELQGMAAELAKSGLKGDALSRALEDAAVKAAKLKWGPNFAEHMNDTDVLAIRLQENLGKIFKLDTKALGAGLAKIVGLFDETSVTGNAIKVVFGSIFQPLIDGAASMVPKIISAFIQIQIWILKALIAIKPFGSTFETIGEIALVFGALFASVFVGVAAVVALVVVAVLGFVKALQDLYNAAEGPFVEIYKRASEMYDYLSGLSLEEIGDMLIQGLADGITNAASSVIDAITGVANGALDAAKSVLQIASPSKAAFRIGGFTGEGMADGIDDQKANVQSSMEALSELPEPSAPGGVGAGSSKGGFSINLAGATITFQGVKDAQTAIANFGDMLLKSLEGDVSQLAGAVPNG